MLCRARFVQSADLVGLHSPVIKALRSYGYQAGLDVSPLFPAWQKLCDRYVAERYNPQISLFGDHATEQTAAWYHFIYHELFPQLVREDEFVRNVLRALAALPCRCQTEAVVALRQYFREITMPSDSPPWAAEQEIESWT